MYFPLKDKKMVICQNLGATHNYQLFFKFRNTFEIVGGWVILKNRSSKFYFRFSDHFMLSGLCPNLIQDCVPVVFKMI